MTMAFDRKCEREHAHTHTHTHTHTDSHTVIFNTIPAVSGGARNFGKSGGACNVSIPSYFIANVHNELYAFYTGKRRLIDKHSESNRGGATFAPLNPPLPADHRYGQPKTNH